MSNRLIVFTLSRRKLVHIVLAGAVETACGLGLTSEIAGLSARQPVTCQCCRRRLGWEVLEKAQPVRSSVPKSRAQRRRWRPRGLRPTSSGPEQPSVRSVIARLRRENSPVYPWVAYVERWTYVSYL